MKRLQQSIRKYYMQMTLRTYIRLILLLLVLYQAQGTPVSTQLQGLQVNTIILARVDSSMSDTYQHNFFSSFSTSPSLALSIIGFQGHESNQASSFQIILQSVNITGFLMRWQRNVQKWIRMKLNYIASSRSDLTLGCQQLQIPASQNSSISLPIQLGGIPNWNTSIFRTFLLGCDSSNSSLSCGIIPISLNSTSLTVKVQSKSQLSIRVSFSYIIFSPSSAGFTSYGGYISKQNFQGSVLMDVHKTIAYTSYRFQGISYLQAVNLQGIATSIDDSLAFSLYSEGVIDALGIFYIILGKTSADLCGNSSFQYQTECVSACPNTAYTFRYSIGGQSCRECSSQLNLIMVNGQCVASSSTNSLMSLSSIFDTKYKTKKRTPLPEERIEKISEPYESVIQRSVAQTICQINEYLMNGFCFCKVGYSNISGTCRPFRYSQPEMLAIVLQGRKKIRVNGSSSLNFTKCEEPVFKPNLTENTQTDIISNTCAPQQVVPKTASNVSNPSVTNSTINKVINQTINQSNSTISASPIPAEKEKSQPVSQPTAPLISSPSKDILSTDEKTSPPQYGLKLSGSIRANNNQIYLTLDTTFLFSFPESQTMRRFIIAKFKGCPPPSFYCSQQAAKKNLFDCLLIFPSGVPNRVFTADFSYSYQSKSANVSLQIDSLKAVTNSARRSNSRAA